ncbi:SDR family oxidoreductase [Acinetobacter sp. MD2(2019)]|uniref:SDR family oxidoreductase n=1 Tax=Acinetobacter sp. MD2(2019) TaxID=2605273 RepID=UPI002D1EFCE5|nr:SDR family oxidoreductase [Acinetobacter sp. MD2(2019)]MEB3753759.1 SDR family oxidoreductase [Acinetobacter sp. MD2(2019)]
MKIGITGATGQLGQLVVAQLQKTAPQLEIVALVRNTEKAKALFKESVEIRKFDYSEPASLAAALDGLSQILLISSSEIGQRIPQHTAVIQAAQNAKLNKIVYTSLLNADHSPLGLATEHKATEQLIKQSGLNYAILRNNWYSENHLANLAHVIEQGVLYGAAENGRISAASRQDYAEAAANVLTLAEENQKIYELAGSSSFTLAELAQMISTVAKTTVRYENLSAADYTAALISAGLPDFVADILVDADVQTAAGAMYSQAKDLEQLLGRKTTPILTLIEKALT